MNRAIVIIGIGLGLLTTVARGQESGTLLVASEQLEDRAFRETVVLLVHHGQEGSVGVAINRPTWVTARDVFPRLDYLHGYRGDVFHGGPLAQATVLIMTRGLPPSNEARPLLDDVFMHSNLDAIEDTFDRRLHDPSALRFYAGHASWGPGQLDEELASGAWKIVPGAAALIFDPDPATLWQRLIGSGSNLTVEQRAPAPLPRARERLTVAH